MRFNINHEVRIRLTDEGRRILRARAFPLPAEDADGWSTWQLWVLMAEFGRYVFIGSPLPFETTIEITTKEA